MLRQICGSIQYAAVHTRPDLAAKVGELQAAIPCGRIEHLISANRVLYEAETKAVSLMIVPIGNLKSLFVHSVTHLLNRLREIHLVTCPIFATDGKLVGNHRTVICPVALSSRKIPRVVRSTLSAEAVALGSALDCLSWVRIF